MKRAGRCDQTGWLWLRESRGWVLDAIGGLILFLYGVVPTFQPAGVGQQPMTGTWQALPSAVSTASR